MFSTTSRANPPPRLARTTRGRSSPTPRNMPLRAEIPYGAYWSTPFARWQGSLAHLHSIEFAAHVAKAELARRGVAPDAIDFGVLGLSVPQPHAFYVLPWLARLAGGRP